MGEKPQNIKHRHISLGVLAHVDAGKTTLSEGLLFKCGRIRKIGRVDHKDAYLDTYELERERGITIKAQTVRTVYKIPMSLRGREESPFFQSRQFFPWGIWK